MSYTLVLISNEQAVEIVNGMAELEVSLPLVSWENVLIPLFNNCNMPLFSCVSVIFLIGSFQKSVIIFVACQSSGNSEGMKHLVQFVVQLPTLHSLEVNQFFIECICYIILYRCYLRKKFFCVFLL